MAMSLLYTLAKIAGGFVLFIALCTCFVSIKDFNYQYSLRKARRDNESKRKPKAK